MNSTSEETGPIVEADDTGIQPLRDGDTSVTADPADDPAQAEWDRTTLLDEGASPDELDGTTATGADPDEIPSDDDEIPFADLPMPNSSPSRRGRIRSWSNSARTARAICRPKTSSSGAQRG